MTNALHIASSTHSALLVCLVATLCGRAASDDDLAELLIIAAVQNDASAVSDMLESGVSADSLTSEKGVTVLMMASMMGHVEVVKVLLHHGATIDRWERSR